MFAHFTDMYEKRTTSAPGAVNFRAVSFESAGTAGCIDPDECKTLVLLHFCDLNF